MSMCVCVCVGVGVCVCVCVWVLCVSSRVCVDEQEAGERGRGPFGGGPTRPDGGGG